MPSKNFPPALINFPWAMFISRRKPSDESSSLAACNPKINRVRTTILGIYSTAPGRNGLDTLDPGGSGQVLFFPERRGPNQPSIRLFLRFLQCLPLKKKLGNLQRIISFVSWQWRLPAEQASAGREDQSLMTSFTSRVVSSPLASGNSQVPETRETGFIEGYGHTRASQHLTITANPDQEPRAYVACFWSTQPGVVSPSSHDAGYPMCFLFTQSS